MRSKQAGCCPHHRRPPCESSLSGPALTLPQAPGQHPFPRCSGLCGIQHLLGGPRHSLRAGHLWVSRQVTRAQTSSPGLLGLSGMTGRSQGGQCERGAVGRVWEREPDREPLLGLGRRAGTPAASVSPPVEWALPCQSHGEWGSEGSFSLLSVSHSEGSKHLY